MKAKLRLPKAILVGMMSLALSSAYADESEHHDMQGMNMPQQKGHEHHDMQGMNMPKQEGHEHHETPEKKTTKEAKSKEDKPLYWVAPMDSNYRRDKPGKSPMGMDLVPVYANDGAGAGDVKVSSAMQMNFGVRTADVKWGRLPLSVSTMGNVVLNENLISHVHTRTTGWIEHLYADQVGQKIHKGERLFDFYSPDLYAAQQDYLQSLGRSLALAKTAEKRLKLLGISDKQLKALKITKKASYLVTVYADQEGFVQQLNVRKGMYITPGLEVMALAGLDSVWIEAHVFEKQSDWMELGQTMDIALDTEPRRHFKAKVDFVSPYTDLKSRTLVVRATIDNPSDKLKPGMFVNVTIDAGETQVGAIIPRQALIKTENQDRVVIKTAADRFQSVMVRAGLGNQHEILVLKGLKSTDKVVTSGQFLIDSESNTDASQLRMEEH